MRDACRGAKLVLLEARPKAARPPEGLKTGICSRTIVFNVMKNVTFCFGYHRTETEHSLQQLFMFVGAD